MDFFSNFHHWISNQISSAYNWFFAKNENLFLAIENGNVGYVSSCMAENGDVNEVIYNGFTPLQAAAKFGQNEIAYILLQNGALVNKANNNGHTALSLAVQHNHLSTIRCLFEEGAHLEPATPDVKSPLLIAVKMGYLKATAFLLHLGANPNVFDQYMVSPLLIASHLEDTKILETLLDHGANPNLRYDQPEGLMHMPHHGYQYTPLYLASLTGNEDGVNILLSHGAEVDLPGKNSLTPLLIACAKGYETIAKTLVTAGADCHYISPDIWTPYPNKQDAITTCADQGIDIAGLCLEIAQQDQA